GIVDLRVLADELLEEDCRHGRYIFVAESDVGEDESFIARLPGGHADLALGGIDHPATRKNLLTQRHRTALRLGRMEDNLTLQARHVVVKQPAVLDDAARDPALSRRERRKG